MAPVSVAMEAAISVLRRFARCFLDVLRAAQLALIFLPTAILTPLALLHPKYFAGAWGRSLTRALEDGGATFTKLGQWAGTRPDLFPESLIKPLRKLHEAVEAEPWSSTARAIEEAFGQPPEAWCYSYIASISSACDRPTRSWYIVIHAHG